MDECGLAQIVHALPRRVHLRAPRLAGHPDALDGVARALAAGGAFAKVSARPATGSIIVEDDERALDAKALARRLDELVRVARDASGRSIPELRPEDHPGPTRVARAVAHAAAAINTDIRVALDDRADLGTLLPVFFVSAGLAEAAKSRTLSGPTWFNLLWWSLRSFMTFNIRAVDEEVKDSSEGPSISAM
ncbi:Hypothetical protein A7982_04858 [Minicystis rosea]|nr:Hypothetical protein A7982_04858 [Minicystis rosea]